MAPTDFICKFLDNFNHVVLISRLFVSNKSLIRIRKTYNLFTSLVRLSKKVSLEKNILVEILNIDIGCLYFLKDIRLFRVFSY